MRKSFSFALGGGLDEISQPLTIDPGRMITCLNHESVDSGYGRIDGFERLDGRTSPTDYPFWVLPFNTGRYAISAGDLVIGADSGATGVVLVDPPLTAGAWAGNIAGSLEAETITLLEAMDVPPDAVRIGHINTLIAGLKGHGIWAKLDWLSLFASHDAQAARLNLVDPAQGFTETGALGGLPTFIADVGYLGVNSLGVLGFLDSGWNPATHGVNFTQNSAMVAAFTPDNVANNGYVVGNQLTSLTPRTMAGNIAASVNQSVQALIAAPGATSVGLTAADRSGASAGKVFRNGVEVGTDVITEASSALTTENFYGLTRNVGGTGPAADPVRRISALAWGGHLNAVEHAQLYTRLDEYLTSIAEDPAEDVTDDAEGVLGIRSLTGSFDSGEDLIVGSVMHARAAGAEIIGAALSGDDGEEDAAEAARTYARSLIEAVPGAGPVRGAWYYDGDYYAFRDNVGATAGVMWKSTAAGWEQVGLGERVNFTSGGTYEIMVDDIITGAISAATATVCRVVLQSGDWGAGDAAGYLVLILGVGTFEAENLNVGAETNVATIAGTPSAITLPPGGRYFFENHNFYGASGMRRMYGVNGVGFAFEFDDVCFTPIETGAGTDTPERIAIFRNSLFLSFPNGSVQGSQPGEPIGWEALLGAFEFGIGSDVADFIASTASLTVLGTQGIFTLTGNDSDDFVLETITREAGAKPFTGQRIGEGVYLDNRGLRSIAASQAYGNFAMGRITETVKKTLLSKANAGAMPIASAIVRSKNQYRLFYDDGSGLSFYLGRKFPEPSYFDLGKTVTCVASVESDAGEELVLFGDDEGFVYRLDRGTSFDGEAIEAMGQLAYSHMRSPNLLKRVHKIGIEATADGGTPIALGVEFDYSSNEQLSTSVRELEAEGAGGIWDISRWNEFFWSSPVENVLEADVEGQGRNASIIFYSNSTRIPPYVLRGATLHYSERGQTR